MNGPPSSPMRQLDMVPADRPVMILLRHAARDALHEKDAGRATPVTAAGRSQARKLGRHLQGRLRTLHTSPILRCRQTARAINDGAASGLPIRHDRLLGDPGVYVRDGDLAWKHWQTLGERGVISHLMTSDRPLAAMANPVTATRRLVRHMRDVAGGRPGLHVFVTHDLLVITAAARLLSAPLTHNDRPDFLEGLTCWQENDRLHVAYRDRSARIPMDE